MNDERGIEKDKGNGVLPCVSGSLPTPEQNKKAMLRSKIKFVNNMDKFSSRKNAYKQGWKDCYEWIMSQSNDR